MAEDRGVKGTLALDHRKEAFLAIARHVIPSRHVHEFLSSAYYTRMLDDHLSTILLERQHFEADANSLGVMKIFMKVFPTAAEYILYGDTESYDNLAKQIFTPEATQEIKALAREYIKTGILHNVLLRAANDINNSREAKTLEGKPLAGFYTHIAIVGAHEDKQAFLGESDQPVMVVPVSGAVDKGQMLSGPPDIHLTLGLILYHLGQHERAIAAFDLAIARGNADLQAAAWNNKGLAQEALGSVDEARKDYEKSIELNPNLLEPQNNLKRLTDSGTKDRLQN